MNSKIIHSSVVLLLMLSSHLRTCPAAEDDELPPAISGVVQYSPPADEDGTPQRFRLPAHEFEFAEQPLREVSDRIAVSLVRFPSPVETSHAANNTAMPGNRNDGVRAVVRIRAR